MPDVNLLFPNDAAPAAAPDWYRSRVGAAENRLMGRHGSQDTASALFPTEPKAAPIAPAAPKAKALEDVAAALFHTDRAPDLHSKAVEGVIGPWAEAARLEGDAELAAEWREAATTLSDDFRQAGMDADQVTEVMQLAREALGNTLPGMPVDEERLLRMNEQGLAWMTERGVQVAEIDAARRMIDDLDLKTPGLKDYLDHTGLGSDPRMIEKAIAEAKRRNYL
jgi:predicted GNAT family acetyltransferase